MTLIKPLFYHLFDSPLVRHVLRRRWEGHLGIIMLHGVHDDAMMAQARPPRSSIHVQQLRQHLLALSRHYRFISLDHAVDMLEGRRPFEDNCFVLTFDDSLKCQIQVTAPLLKELNIPATIYVSTDVIEKGTPYWWHRLEYAFEHAVNHSCRVAFSDGSQLSFNWSTTPPPLRKLKKRLKWSDVAERERIVTSIEQQLEAAIATADADPYAQVLTWEDVRSLAAEGFTIGSHTVSHPNLAMLSEAQLQHELSASRAIIQQRCGIACDHLAFPYGYVSAQARKKAAACGYRSAVSTEGPGWNPPHGDRFLLRRFALPHERRKLSYTLSGVGETIARLRKRPGNRPPRRTRNDTDGRARMLPNILSSWGALGVLTISGFVIPRLIDTNLGQHGLGVWDFAWTIVAYLGLVQAGVVSSINRYVALHRSRDDIAGVNRAISSVTGVLCLMGGLIIVLTLVCAWWVTDFFGMQLGDDLNTARWVVLLLGASTAVQVTLSAFGGVLTGSHRWDLHNGIYAGAYAFILAGMLAALLLGKGLIGLAAVSLTGESIGWGLRWLLAYRVCPGLRVSPRLFDRRTAAEMLGFGGKSFVPYLGELMLNQTVNLLIVGHLGPAALALFSRPRALLRSVVQFMNKYAVVLVPTASSLDGRGDRAEVQALLLKAARYAGYLSLPIILFLSIMGGEVLQLWMGRQYRDDLLVAVLILGQLAMVTAIPLLAVLSALNLHGRPGLVNFLAQAVALVLAWLALNTTDLGLTGVAIAIGIPITLTSGIYLPLYTCRSLQISPLLFVKSVWRGPLLCGLPFAACLIASRIVFRENATLALAAAAVSGGVVVGGCYWLWVIPPAWKQKVLGRLRIKPDRPLEQGGAS